MLLATINSREHKRFYNLLEKYLRGRQSCKPVEIRKHINTIKLNSPYHLMVLHFEPSFSLPRPQYKSSNVERTGLKACYVMSSARGRN